MELNNNGEYELHNIIRKTRDEPGVSIKRIADIIDDNFAVEETDILVKELKERVNNKK